MSCFFIVKEADKTIYISVEDRNNECPLVSKMVLGKGDQKDFEYDYEDILKGLHRWASGEDILDALSFITYEDRAFLVN